MDFSVLFRWRLDSAMVTSQTAKGGHLPRLELLEPDDVDVMCRATGACRWVREAPGASSECLPPGAVLAPRVLPRPPVAGATP